MSHTRTRWIRRAAAYWVPTTLVAMNWTYGGTHCLLQSPSSMAVLRSLGYPSYFALLLGTAQLLAVFAIVAPVPRTVREWAYAGLTFDVVSAIVSLIATGTSLAGIIIPVIALLLVIVSYTAWKARLGDIQPLHAYAS